MERCIKIYVDELSLDFIDLAQFVIDELEPSLNVKRVRMGDDIYINPEWVAEL